MPQPACIMRRQPVKPLSARLSENPSTTTLQARAVLCSAPCNSAGRRRSRHAHHAAARADAPRHACGWAADGLQALAQWRPAPDAVVLDLSLPGLDGLQVLAQARRQGLRTPVLILTARGTVGDRVLGLNAGADDYLAKPFDLDELEARLRALLRRSAGGGRWRRRPGGAPGRMRYERDSGAIYHWAAAGADPRERADARAAGPPGHAAQGAAVDLVFPARPRCSTRPSRWWPTGCASWRHRRAPGHAARPGLSAQGRAPRPDPAPAQRPSTTWSLRRQLLVGICCRCWPDRLQHLQPLPRTAASLHTAYDRTLLASAKSISEQLDVHGYDEQAQLRATVPYSALEIFEADNQSRMFYRVSSLDGALVSGFPELPMWHGSIPARPPYARWWISTTPLSRPAGARGRAAAARGQRHRRSMAVIQVAETLELRQPWRCRCCATRCGARPCWWRWWC
jgi:CheY-like chemotaxis protein